MIIDNKALGSSTAMAISFDVVFPRFLSFGIRAFHYVTHLQTSGIDDDDDDAIVAMFAWE